MTEARKLLSKRYDDYVEKVFTEAGVDNVLSREVTTDEETDKSDASGDGEQDEEEIE